MPSTERDPSATEVCRFAPSTTGEAHPGTLLAALLAWLDARSRSARFILRLEDLDPDRCKPEWADAMLRDLEWLGLDWDEHIMQSEESHAHDATLDELAKAGRLYPCTVSRSEIKKHGRRSPDGGFAYPNLSRGRALPAGGWRQSDAPLRAHLPDRSYEPREESEHNLVQIPSHAMGDPIVRRRDGSIAYNLAVVVDDDQSGMTRIVRGHDIAASTATHLALMDLLDIREPTYRHHLLLLEPRGDKLAKLHGSVGARELRGAYSPEALCGLLLQWVGLQAKPTPLMPTDAISLFGWQRIGREDVPVYWDSADGVLRRL